MPERDDVVHDAEGRRLRRIGLIALAIALAVVALGIVLRMRDHRTLQADAQGNDTPAVTVVMPTRAKGGTGVSLPGAVQAYNSAPIFARTNGYVRRWLVDIGDTVRAGQVLAILDAPEVDQQLAQARANYQTALANRTLARSTAARWQTLLAKDAVSRQEADEKAGDLAAKTAVANAAAANVGQLEAQRGFTRLVAPFAGTVTSRSAQIGALVTAGSAASQPLFTVSDIHSVRVYVRVPQSYSAQVHPGQTATLTVPEYAGRTFPATVTRSAGAVDPQSGTVLIELQAANGDHALKPGGYAQVRFAAAAGDASLHLPSSTLILGDQGATVAVVGDDGRVALRPVVVGRDEGKTIEIRSGLSGRERVIDTPPDALAEGDRVTIVPGAKGKPAGAGGDG